MFDSSPSMRSVCLAMLLMQVLGEPIKASFYSPMLIFVTPPAFCTPVFSPDCLVLLMTACLVHVRPPTPDHGLTYQTLRKILPVADI